MYPWVYGLAYQNRSKFAIEIGQYALIPYYKQLGRIGQYALITYSKELGRIGQYALKTIWNFFYDTNRFYSSRQTHMYPWVYGLGNQNRSKFAIEK